MREKQAAVCLENAIGSPRLGSPRPAGVEDEDLRARVQIAESLAALDLVGASHVRESLRAQLQQATRERQARAAAPPGRRPWTSRRPLLAAEVALLLVVVSLAVLAPQSLAAFVERVARVIQMVRVGEHTQIVREAPLSDADEAAIQEQHKTRLAKGESWFLRTPYGGFGGNVPPGERAGVSYSLMGQSLTREEALNLIPLAAAHRGSGVALSPNCPFSPSESGSDRPKRPLPNSAPDQDRVGPSRLE